MVKEFTGTILFQQDTRKYHRFEVTGPGGLCGTIYFLKGEGLPDKVVLERKQEDD